MILEYITNTQKHKVYEVKKYVLPELYFFFSI